VDKFVLKVALEYKNMIGVFGGTFNFPKADSIVDTYAYRSFNAFVKKCKSFHLENDQILEVIRIVVRHMHKYKMIKKGIGILSSPDVVDICVDELKKQILVSENVIKILSESNKFLNRHPNKIEFLTKKINGDGLPNLVFFRCNGTLPDLFMCCSKSCMTAYCKLDKSDRTIMLEPKDYLILKMKIINMVGDDNIKKILGSDSNV
jgi:hypothetical protein